ncbi:hypothetical protein [Paenibacillus xylanexedens]|uniref:hypothetical protein n=1 Tax=Paenibacillus xylanexedens TaxID=528191 RepID=UPI0011A3FAED|nr:hypothetical protein [Paenibacillus xylanexedens]
MTMKHLAVEPGQSIGDIRLGMTQSEVEQTEAFTLDPKVEYDAQGKAHFIEFYESDEYKCMLGELDLLGTEADILIPQLDAIAPYDREDPELGCSFQFDQIGLILWRPVPMTREDMQEPWFLEMPPENQQDEMKHLCFSTAAVYAKGYYE